MIATSPAYHDHSPQRLFAELPGHYPIPLQCLHIPRHSYLGSHPDPPVWNNPKNRTDRLLPRCFSREELHAILAAQGFEIIDWGGISAFSLLLSFLSKLDRLGPHPEAQLAAVHQLLINLGRNGCSRRCHVVIAAK